MATVANSFVAAFVLLVGPPVTFLFRATWSTDNRRNMRRKVQAEQPSDPRRIERFVLTDATLYLIGLRDGNAEVCRIPRKTILSAVPLDHGDVAVETSKGSVVLKAPRQAAELLARLGIAASAVPEGVPPA